MTQLFRRCRASVTAALSVSVLAALGVGGLLAAADAADRVTGSCTIVDNPTRTRHTECASANLSRAHLSHADLSEADLSRADLSRADLSRADLSDADLSRADLSRADLSRAILAERQRAALSKPRSRPDGGSSGASQETASAP